eukprot:m.1645436 g.1645436  ORF g.1645436 m.1645436 type:complete len:95 (+) comp67330_c0_seq1:85-369(+)
MGHTLLQRATMVVHRTPLGTYWRIEMLQVAPSVLSFLPFPARKLVQAVSIEQWAAKNAAIGVGAIDVACLKCCCWPHTRFECAVGSVLYSVAFS